MICRRENDADEELWYDFMFSMLPFPVILIVVQDNIEFWSPVRTAGLGVSVYSCRHMVEGATHEAHVRKRRCVQWSWVRDDIRVNFLTCRWSLDTLDTPRQTSNIWCMDWTRPDIHWVHSPHYTLSAVLSPPPNIIKRIWKHFLIYLFQGKPFLCSTWEWWVKICTCPPKEWIIKGEWDDVCFIQ